MALNEIEYAGTVYGDSAIEAATSFAESSYVGDTLPYSTLEADVWDYGRATLRTVHDGMLVQDSSGMFTVAKRRAHDLTAYNYSDRVKWSHRGNLLMSRYITSCARIGKYKFRLSCVSEVGLIAEAKHYGGLYSGVLLSELIRDIIGTAFKYDVSPELAGMTMYGWLPVGTRRSNLQKLMTASGAIIRYGEDGGIIFTAPTTDTVKGIYDSDIFSGGSVDYPTPYKSVKITEHEFVALATDDVVTLYDGESATEPIITPVGISLEGNLITFDEPVHDLKAENVEILESGVNYAVLGPSPACKVTGLSYTHTRRVITFGDPAAGDQATKRLDDNCLVNLLNSENVGERWFQYYSSQREAKLTAVWNGEQTSDAVSLSDSYDDPMVGIVSAMDIRLSAKLAADMTILSGNLPDIIGNYFNNVLVVTESGPVTIPVESKGRLRVVLIGGGDGGEPGENGQDGQETEFNSNGVGGAGGAGGAGGSGGKINIVKMSVAPGSVINAVIGAGGIGGEPGGTAGRGKATTFGGYSSESGLSAEDGYTNLIGGETYGTHGASGVKGGDGGGTDDPAESVTYDGQTWDAGANGEDATSGSMTSGGGGGGGAAVGSSGTAGEDGDFRTYTDGRISPIRAGGGDGGSATIPGETAVIRGQGGQGGHGGGGGGGEGRISGSSSYTALGSGLGTGGTGSRGGDGAPGILFIYY